MSTKGADISQAYMERACRTPRILPVATSVALVGMVTQQPVSRPGDSL